MTDEQKAARRVSAESGNIRWIKDNCLRTMDDADDYVFISYKSNDYEKVLDDIVYNTCRKYGLKVYFDVAFDDASDSWITQYYNNMCDPKCKAFIAFIDDAYFSSYACLLEMMSHRTLAAGGDYEVDTLFFLPIKLGPINDIKNTANTGLGTQRFADGKINEHAPIELKCFNEIFSDLISLAESDDVSSDIKKLKNLKNFYKRANDFELYKEPTETSPIPIGKMYLNITQCRKLMELVIPKKNDNDGTNKDFVEAIHDKLMKAGISSVFGHQDPPPKTISWKEFDASVKAFSCGDKSYNVPDAQQAYCAIVDVVKQMNPSLDVAGITGGEMPYYVVLTDGSHLDMPNGGYGSFLKAESAVKSAVTLYGEPLPDALDAPKYEVIKREEQPPVPPEWFCDSIERFNRYFLKLSAQHKDSWKKRGLSGNTPAIDLEIKLRFDIDALEHHTISGYKWKAIFTDVMNYFYQISGDAYYEYAVALYSQKGLKEPSVISPETYENQIQDKDHYAPVNKGTYYFVNFYSAKELVRALIRQVDTYLTYLREKQGSKDADLSRVMVEYKISDMELRKMMAEIRNGAGPKPRGGDSPMPAAGLVAFEEPLSEFLPRYRKLFDQYSKEWKASHTGNTPSVPFSDIRIHMPADTVKNPEVSAGNWKPLFNKIMEEFCQSSEGKFFELRAAEEAQKGNKYRAVFAKEDYGTGDIDWSRYQPIADGTYYFFNSYGTGSLIDAMTGEIRMYIDFVNNTRSTESGLDEVMISYCLPEGEFAELFG